MHGHKYILVHNLDVVTFVIVRVASAMDNFHLFDECTFSRLSRPCGKYTEMIPLDL